MAKGKWQLVQLRTPGARQIAKGKLQFAACPLPLSEFLLVAVFSQTFFALVRGNLVPFTFFTAGQGISPPLQLGFT
jgi:hypothetical protein